MPPDHQKTVLLSEYFPSRAIGAVSIADEVLTLGVDEELPDSSTDDERDAGRL